jgi:peptidoglycan/xylan/chitin deacetylase (PgdA/CDA1 family)
MRGKALIVLLLSIVILSAAQHVGGQDENAKKYVIFRDDDVQPGYKLKTLKAVNQVHVDKNVPVTLGIIPHPYLNRLGNELYMDRAFLEYMKSISSNQLFEFAQHGYTHHDVTGTLNKSEFYGVPYASQYKNIKQGQSDIENAFGIRPTTFTPPFDRGDNNTLQALKSLGFTDYSTAFGDFNVYQGYREGIKIDSVSLILDDVTLRFAKNETERLFSEEHGSNTIIVFYHFATFSESGEVLNETKLQLLESYIDYLKQRGDVTFTKLDRSYLVEGITSEKQNIDTTSHVNSTTTHSSIAGSKETSENGDPFWIGNKHMWPLLAFVIPAYAIVFLGGLLTFNRLSNKKVKRKH